VLALQLEAWGCRHTEVADAESALQALRSGLEQRDPFEIAILDMQMPATSGEELGRRITEDPTLKDSVALVMMTSIGQRGDRDRMAAIGFAAYLTKPVKQSQLHDCLAIVIERNAEAGAADRQPEVVTRHTLDEESRRRTRILLAEDNAVNRKVALKVLEKMGFRADAVTNGREVIETLEQVPYDLILMDVHMPEMDGLEAARRIRERERSLAGGHLSLEGEAEVGPGDQCPMTGDSVRPPHIPIIALTAGAMEKDRQECLAAGMDDYVVKPLRPQEIIEAVEQQLQFRRSVKPPSG